MNHSVGVLLCVIVVVELVWMFSDRHRAVHPDTSTLPDLLEYQDCQESLVGSRLTTDTEVHDGEPAGRGTAR